MATIDRQNRKAPRPEWLHTDWLLARFGASRSRQIARYIEFVQQGVRGPRGRDQPGGRVFAGSDEFIESVQKELHAAAKRTVKEIPGVQRRALANSLAD